MHTTLILLSQYCTVFYRLHGCYLDVKDSIIVCELFYIEILQMSAASTGNKSFETLEHLYHSLSEA